MNWNWVILYGVFIIVVLIVPDKMKFWLMAAAILVILYFALLTTWAPGY